MLKTLIFIIGLTLTTSGVAGELLQFTKIDEIPERPGLFSKGSEDGVVVFSTVYSSTFGGSDEEVDTSSSLDVTNADSPQPAPTEDEEYKKFLDWQWERFQQWKK